MPGTLGAAASTGLLLSHMTHKGEIQTMQTILSIELTEQEVGTQDKAEMAGRLADQTQ